MILATGPARSPTYRASCAEHKNSVRFVAGQTHEPYALASHPTANLRTAAPARNERHDPARLRANRLSWMPELEGVGPEYHDNEIDFPDALVSVRPKIFRVDCILGLHSRLACFHIYKHSVSAVERSHAFVHWHMKLHHATWFSCCFPLQRSGSNRCAPRVFGLPGAAFYIFLGMPAQRPAPDRSRILPNTGLNGAKPVRG